MQILLPCGMARLAVLLGTAAKGGCGRSSCSHLELTWGLLMSQAEQPRTAWGGAAGRTPAVQTGQGFRCEHYTQGLRQLRTASGGKLEGGLVVFVSWVFFF